MKARLDSKTKILTAAVLCACTTLWASPVWAVELTINSIDEYQGYKGNSIIGGSGSIKKPLSDENNNVIIFDLQETEELNESFAAGSGVGNSLTINNGIYDETVYGSADGQKANNNTVTIHKGKFKNIYGGEARGTGTQAIGNIVTINGGEVSGFVTGAWLTSGEDGQLKDNYVYINNDSVIKTIYGGHSWLNASDNIVEINDKAVVTNAYGGYGTGSGEITQNVVKITDNVTINGLLYGGYGAKGKTIKNKVEISGEASTNGNWVMGGYSPKAEANENEVEISGGTVNSNIAGGYGTTASGNKVMLSGGIIGTNYVYGGYGTNNADDNIITLTNDVDIANVQLYGSNIATENAIGNTLLIDGWESSNTNGNVVSNIQRFNNITFKNLQWENNGIALNITNTNTYGDLFNTRVNIDNLTLANDKKLQAGDKMTFIQSNLDTGLTLDNVAKTEDISIAQGVATVGKMDMSIEGETNNLVGKITGVSLNDQTKLVAENRAVAAAFINQGTDLISDSLDVISRDGKYGIKTFAAVQGNRSKYDVNSDLKINGWSTIVGVGNENEHNGGDFSWGVFYENGSGNYRTFNSFNNEFFRGDGSLVYNGGGIAARYENAHGVYTEGSLRAGMLKSEMTNALRDGDGNNYGYKSESEYYGAHIGVGQIIPLTESSDLDVYGKFFHTYTQGDSFDVDGDKFEFDGIDNDRLRVGARITTNKANKFSTYYGLAYEYEFNGDAEMRAAGLSAPEQSLQGSSYMAELGFNYQPTPESPWNFDLNMRGYAGEREGATFNVQATYTF